MQNLRWFPALRQHSYPHFRRAEASLWDEFIQHNPHNLSKVAFDVTVGQGRTLLAKLERRHEKDWRYLSSFKVDALGKSPFGFVLYELKEECHANAFGQLLVYDALLRRDSPEFVPYKRCVIARNIHQDLYFPASMYNIDLIDLLWLRNASYKPSMDYSLF